MSAIPKMPVEAKETVVPPYARRTGPIALEIALPELTAATIRQAREDQAAFDKQFRPMRSSDTDVLILTWGEIERQFMDLCAPWEHSSMMFRIRQARQIAFHQSAERVLRELWVIAHCSSETDTAPPRLGSGKWYPMP